MKEYTVDFESFEVEAESYEEAWKIAQRQAWKDHGWKLDDELLPKGDPQFLRLPKGSGYVGGKGKAWYCNRDEAFETRGRWIAVFNSLHVEARNSNSAWNKAVKFAKRHNLDIIEMDDGYDI